MQSDRWKRGEQAELATRAGITQGFLSQMLYRRTRPSRELALALASVCEDMRIPITSWDWAFNLETNNPFFHGAPICPQR